MRISIKEHKDKVINLKVHEGFNMVRLIISISTNEREYFHYFIKHRVQKLDNQSTAITRKKHKITKP